MWVQYIFLTQISYLQIILKSQKPTFKMDPIARTFTEITLYDWISQKLKEVDKLRAEIKLE